MNFPQPALPPAVPPWRHVPAFLRRLARIVAYGAVIGYVAFALLVLTVRTFIMPEVHNYRPQIEQAISAALGLPVHIGALSASWQGFRPEVHLAELRLDDADGQPVLRLPAVHAVISWRSLLLMAPHVHRLRIEAASLVVSRDPDGRLRVAGLPLDTTPDSDSALANWVLEQPEIELEQATLTWLDHQRAAPPLIFEQLRLRVVNGGSRHRLGLTGRLRGADAVLIESLDLRADLRGTSLAALDQWRGELFVDAAGVPLGGFAPWFDYPRATPAGDGSVRAWLRVDAGRLQAITADLALRGVQATLAADLPALALDRLSGRLSAVRGPEGMRLSSRDLRIVLADGTSVAPLTATGQWREAADGISGEARFNEIDLATVVRLADALPLDARGRTLLQRYAPRGQLREVSARFEGGREKLSTYAVSAHFAELGLNADGAMPGFEGLSGELRADERGGALLLRSGPSALSLPAVFPESRITFDSLAAQVKWTRPNAEAVDVDIAQASFSGPDAVGSASGQYHYDGSGPGRIDLTARIGQADGRAVWRYMPRVVGDATRQWLRTAILGGSAHNAELRLQGDLAFFPFRDGRNGTFRVTADIRDAVLDYADGWPRIDGINGDLRFEGVTMTIRAQRGRIAGTEIREAVAAIADLEVLNEQLTVDGRVVGPTQRFLDFIEASPVGRSIEHATAAMQAQGVGELKLGLLLPLRDPGASRINGEYRLSDNTLTFVPGLPPLEKLNGRVTFTGNEIAIPAATASFLGQPARLSGQPRDGLLAIKASGALTAAAARRFYGWPLFDHVSGTTPFTADIRVRKTSADVTVDSALDGLSVSLPAPFNKSAGTRLPLRVERRLLAAGGGEREHWRVRLGDIAEADAERAAGGPLTRLTVAVGEPLPKTLPPGWAATVNLPEIDVNFWRGLLPANATSGPAKAPSVLPALTVRTPRLIAGGRVWHDVSMRAAPVDGGYDGSVSAREASGNWFWRGPAPGRVQARLKELILAGSDAATGPDAEASTADPRDWPMLDLVADRFVFAERQFGRLELKAAGEGADNVGGWRISKLALTNPDGVIEAAGLWRLRPSVSTALKVGVDARNVGGLLGRLGYPDTVRGGKASLKGELRWAGAPHAVDYGTLSGALSLNAEDGQFAKLKPGVGKLIGLLSLQALPRRLFLDFSDVISEGFAFDTIASEMKINQGVLHTDELTVRGPSARVLMRGDVNLARETQDLRVSVQPELSSTASLGVAVLNPVAGVAALLAQKFLGNPLDKAFAFDYHVTGSWAEPQVDKVARPRAGGDNPP